MWRVKFSNSQTHDLERRTLHIFPLATSWNDFGYRYRAILKFRCDGVCQESSISVIPLLDGKTPVSELSTWVASLNANETFNVDQDSELKFFSLFKDIDCYEAFAKKISITDSNQIFRYLNDITYLRSFGLINAVLYDRLIYSSEFRLGVLRYPDAWKAFRRGHLNARYTPKLNDAKNDFSYNCRLAGHTNKHTVKFHFKRHRYFDDRVHCIIGVNGIGKTRYLQSLIYSLCQNANNEKLYPTPSVLTYSTIHSPLTNPGNEHSRTLPKFNYVLGYSSDFETALPTGCNLGGPFQYRYFGINARTQDRSYTEPLGLLFADIYRDHEDSKEITSRYSTLQDSLSGVLDFHSMLLPVAHQYDGQSYFQDSKGEKWVQVSYLRGEQNSLEILGAIDPSRDITISDEEGRPTALSSGQRAFLRFSLHFLSYAENGTLVVIDEPETHLHPNLISQFMVLLYKVLRATKSIAIIATHSVYVVRETPSHCVHIFNRTKHTDIETLQVYTKTLGANINTLSRTVFDDSTVNSYTSRVIDEVAASGLSFTEILNQYEDIFSIEMLMEIKAAMDMQNSI